MLAGSVALSLSVAPMVEVRAAAQDSEIERLYVEGQDKYADGDFAGAADAWTRLLDRLPEAQANRATRENVLLNVLQAHLDGYARNRRDDGSKDIGHLRSAKEVLDAYFASFKKAYGDRAAVSAAVQEKADELDRTLEEAEREAAATPPPPNGDNGSGNQGGSSGNEGGSGGNQGQGGDRPNIVVLESQNDGGGLIVGGAVTAGLSLAGFGLLIYGGILAKRATDDYNNATTQDDRDKAEKQGNTGNALTVTGAIVGPVLLITGGVLIGLGIKRRKDAKAAREQQLKSITVAPTAGRGFGGLVLQGRF
ncbi:MAG: hypothetical protein KDK70_35495 [Myxococcales bacterium]|nr:hypothetical protein [Myxococcales bacterium]